VRYDPAMRSSRVLIAVLMLGCAGSAFAEEPPALAKARMLYNAGSFDAAIESARAATGDRQFADAAALIIARAHLERHRLSAAAEDLTAARETLRTIRRGGLSPRDQVDLLIGLGQTLYFGEQFGAAAELFDAALDRASILAARDRELLLDWWATAVDREAQTRPPERRVALFEQIGTRMHDELELDAGSAVANYWLAVAARGAGDLEGAWDLAVAAWVRASLTPEGSKSLRADLDRLVTEALIPERARTRPQREDPATGLRVEWERIKDNWK
jgi:hypothetical protein